MDFPLVDLLDERACQQWLERHLHPKGLSCPRCGAARPRPVKRSTPTPGWRCLACDRFYTPFTGTVFERTHQSARTLVALLVGVAQGKSSQQLAREIGLTRQQVHTLRLRLQTNALLSRPQDPLPDAAVEVDEMYQNAGEKGEEHKDQEDPPRRRGNQRRGRGTMETDRPPLFTVKGRESGEVRFEVAEHADGKTCVQTVRRHTQGRGTTVHTDEWSGYSPLVREVGVEHRRVSHQQKEHARDEDGDGVREVHINGAEGENLGLRNFLRPFRGVHKHLLEQYVAVYELVRHYRRVTVEAIRRLCLPPTAPQLSLT